MDATADDSVLLEAVLQRPCQSYSEFRKMLNLPEDTSAVQTPLSCITTEMSLKLATNVASETSLPGTVDDSFSPAKPLVSESVSVVEELETVIIPHTNGVASRSRSPMPLQVPCNCIEF